MSDPINPRQVQVTGDHMVTGVITMKEALEREIDKMRPVYDAAMELLAAADGAVSMYEWETLEENLLTACRRAKDGR